MDNHEKKQTKLACATIIIGIVVILASLAGMNTGKSPFKINGFEFIYEVSKQSVEALWAILKLIATVFWTALTKSWFSAIAIIGIIAFLIMKATFDRNERNKN